MSILGALVIVPVTLAVAAIARKFIVFRQPHRRTIQVNDCWEQLDNPGFNPLEFDGIKKQAGLNRFISTAKRWIDATSAAGLISKSNYRALFRPELDSEAISDIRIALANAAARGSRFIDSIEPDTGQQREISPGSATEGNA